MKRTMLAIRRSAAQAMLLGVAIHCYAAQSLVLTPGVTLSPVNNASLATAQSWRVEFRFHDWAPPAIETISATIWGMNGIGANAAILRNGQLWLTDVRDIIGQPCVLTLGTLTDVLVR